MFGTGGQRVKRFQKSTAPPVLVHLLKIPCCTTWHILCATHDIFCVHHMTYFVCTTWHLCSPHLIFCIHHLTYNLYAPHDIFCMQHIPYIVCITCPILFLTHDIFCIHHLSYFVCTTWHNLYAPHLIFCMHCSSTLELRFILLRTAVGTSRGLSQSPYNSGPGI